MHVGTPVVMDVHRHDMQAEGAFMFAGQRSKEYTRLFSCGSFASGVGPALAIGVFLATGNAWTEHALQVL